MTGCPRVEVHATALQLLQILDKRFFGSVVGTLHSDNEKGMNPQHSFITNLPQLQTNNLNKRATNL